MKINKSYRISQFTQELLDEMKEARGDTETFLIELAVYYLWKYINESAEEIEDEE